MNSDPISLLQSKTFWANVVTAGLFAWNLMGHKSTVDANALTDTVYGVFQAVSPFIGLIMSTYFRTITSAPITGVVKAK